MMGWREGDMLEGELWPEDVVRSFVADQARQCGQQSVWTGVAQLIARLDGTIRDAKDQDARRDATHRFHEHLIDELRRDVLRLKAQLRTVGRA